jgi:hypothetical protein
MRCVGTPFVSDFAFKFGTAKFNNGGGPMANRILDMLVLYLPSEWRIGGIRVGADSPGPPGSPPPPRPPGPDRGFGDFDTLEMRMITQLLLARLGGPVTLGEMEPRSISDLNELESRMTAALAELQRVRAELEQGGR